MAPTDVRVPLNARPGWGANADDRSYTDPLLDSSPLDERPHDGEVLRQGAELQNPPLINWLQNSSSAEEYSRIERETRGERYLDALRRENAAVRRQTDILREATGKLRTDMFHINPNAARE